MEADQSRSRFVKFNWYHLRFGAIDREPTLETYWQEAYRSLRNLDSGLTRIREIRVRTVIRGSWETCLEVYSIRYSTISNSRNPIRENLSRTIVQSLSQIEFQNFKRMPILTNESISRRLGKSYYVNWRPRWSWVFGWYRDLENPDEPFEFPRFGNSWKLRCQLRPTLRVPSHLYPSSITPRFYLSVSNQLHLRL